MIMKFTDSQMSGMLIEDADFAEWYVEEFMRKYLPNYYYELSDEGKREMTLNGRNYARRFDIDDPHSQAHFVTLMWQVGPNFFEFPGFREIARDKSLSSRQKIDAFYSVPKEMAIEAITNPDERYWYPYMRETAR